MHADAMIRQEARFRRLMSVLGDPSRWAITHVLRRGGRCVTDLAHEIGLSQSCTTRHLQVLARERVVRGDRAGKRVIYSLREDDAQLAGLLVMGRPDPARAGRRSRRTLPGRLSKPEAARPEPIVPHVPEETPGPAQPDGNMEIRSRASSDIEDWLL